MMITMQQYHFKIVKTKAKYNKTYKTHKYACM